MDKKAVVHIHNGVLLSHKRNKIESVEVRWMNLEPVIQSEISQKETKTSYINAYIWNLMDSLANYLLCLLASFKTTH